MTLNLWPDRENDSPSWAITACILLTNPHHPTSNINVGPDVRGSAKWPSLSIHSAPICQELATATSLESECLDVVCNNFGSWKMNTAWHICRGGVMAKKHSLRMYEHLGFRQPESTIINLRQGCCVCFKRSHLALPWLQPLAGWPPLLTVVSVCFSSLETGYTFGGSIIRSICCNMLYMSISHGELKEKSTSETIPKPPNISNRGNLLIFASKVPIRAKEKTSRSALHLARRSQPAKTPES